MGLSLRESAKQFLPQIIQNKIIDLKNTIKGPPVECVFVRPYRIAFRQSQKRRVTLILPTISSSRFFGGLMTAVDLLDFIIQELEAVEGRILVDGKQSKDDIDVNFSVEFLNAHKPAFEAYENEIFLTFNWWILLNLRRAQSLNGQPADIRADSIFFLMQDYEPAMYEFSGAHVLAKEAFDTQPLANGIFNSNLLFQYFEMMGHSCKESFAFEPTISDSLKRTWEANINANKENILLLYSRPNTPRNCFWLAVQGLRDWVSRYDSHNDWKVLGIGESFTKVDLGKGVFLEPIGKLSLEEYGSLLSRSAVGLSLMASPHPSYPPLEMAAYGLSVITNRYGPKDLSKQNPNIVSLDDFRPETISACLDRLCAAFRPTTLRDRKQENDPFFSNKRFASLERLITQIETQMSRTA